MSRRASMPSAPGDEALVRIDDGTILAGSLPRTAARLVQEWRLRHRDELAVDWQRARALEPLSPIEGLRYAEFVHRPPRITDVAYLGDLWLRLTFSDGLVRELDFVGVLEGGVLEPLNDPAVFSQVAIDPVAGTVVWPNGVDLDPDVLHGDHSPAPGVTPTVRAEYQLRATG